MLALSSSVPAEGSGSELSQRQWQLEKRSPASHTLIVLSQEPETIVLPSGEKATEVIVLLWALSLLALSSRVPVDEGEWM